MSAGLGGNVGSCTSPCCGPFAPNTLANFSTSSAGSLDCNCCSSSGFLPRIPTSQPASSAVRGCKDNNTHQRFATGKHLNLMAACLTGGNVGKTLQHINRETRLCGRRSGESSRLVLSPSGVNGTRGVPVDFGSGGVPGFESVPEAFSKAASNLRTTPPLPFPFPARSGECRSL